VGVAAGYLTAEHYLGENIVSQIADFFNPVSDIKDLADFVDDVMQESTDSNSNDQQKPDDTEDGGQQSAAGWWIDGDMVTGSRACGSRISCN
jgi:hypothetical protein